MFSNGNSWPKSIQTTSKKWGHVFRNQLQPIQSILQLIKLKSLPNEKDYSIELASSVFVSDGPIVNTMK